MSFADLSGQFHIGMRYRMLVVVQMCDYRNHISEGIRSWFYQLL